MIFDIAPLATLTPFETPYYTPVVTPLSMIPGLNALQVLSNVSYPRARQLRLPQRQL